MQDYTKKRWMAALATLTLTVVGCETVPLDQKYTTKQLAAQLRATPLCQPRATDRSAYTPDDDRCAEEERQRKERISAALEARHAREVAAAPQCLQQQHEDPETFRSFGIDPDSPLAVAELISSGVVITGSSLSQQCITEVCAWQARFEPDRDSLGWCPM